MKTEEKLGIVRARIALSERCRHGWLITMLLISALMLLDVTVACGAEPEFDFDIPASTADKALVMFAKQANAQVLFPYEEMTTVSLKGIFGRYTVRKGIEELVDGACLEVKGALVAQTDVVLEIAKRNRGLWFMRNRNCAARKLKVVAYSVLVAEMGVASTLAQPVQHATLEEIIVTAQKREQSLQEVPVSVSVLDRGAVVANRIDNVRDLSGLTPNLTIRPAPGGSAGPSYSMRGIVSLGTAPGSDKGISLYLDGVYVGHTSGSIFELADIDRIEVLKGPQGTLFGRNSTGGAISIITKDPMGEFGFQQSFSYGNYNQFRSKTQLDFPRVGPLSLAARYLHSKRKGDIRNLGAGSTWDYTNSTRGKWGKVRSPKYMGGQDVEAVSLAAKLDLHQDLDINYKFDWSENDFSADGQGVMGLNFAALGPVMGGMLTSALSHQPHPELMTPISNKRPRAVNNDFTSTSYIKNTGHNLTAVWDVTDRVRLKNILAFRKSQVRAKGGLLDGLGGFINTDAPYLGPLGERLVLVAASSYTDEKQWSDELQLNVTAEKHELTAGFLRYDGFTRKGAPEGTATVIQFRVINDGVIPYDGSVRATAKTISNAVYLQDEFHLNERIDLVLGMRKTWDKRHGLDTSLPVHVKFKYRADKITSLAGVNYKLSDDVLSYVKWSDGFISGGHFATLDFDPETAKSWEAGVKADLFDNRLRANLALYRSKYTGLQFITSGAAAGVPSAPQVIMNGGAARAHGLELDLSAILVDNFTLSGNAGFTDFKYTSVNPAVGVLGSYLPVYRPRWTTGLSMQYENTSLIHGANLIIRMDGNYKSKAYNVPNAATPALRRATTTEGYWVVNGRIALGDISLAKTQAEVAIWGKNIFNDKSLAWASNLSFLYAGSYERARTYGIDFTVRY